MYELLTKWGLETIQKIALGKSGHEMSVMLEAIRAKNVLVVERFKYSWTACQSIVQLAIRVEEALPAFLKDGPDTDGSVESVKKLMGSIRNDFHPQYYRELSKLRCQFDAANDLLSSYTEAFSYAVHFNTIGAIATHKHFVNASDIARMYRGVWSFYAKVVSALLRVTSSDLRFWLTDTPYIAVARDVAREDWAAAFDWLKSPEGRGVHYYISLETAEGLEAFWARVGMQRE